jgi:hypothetical protein
MDEELDAVELRIQASEDRWWARANLLHEVVPSEGMFQYLLQVFGPGAKWRPFGEHAGYGVRTVLAEY